MPRETDPFRHHPGLRRFVTDPLTSPLRGFDPETMRPMFREKGIPESFLLDPAHREADRQKALANRPEGPLWVFAYGSLIWDPAILFTEVRRAFAPLHERRMILKDIWGGRGDADSPGVMAALDDGTGCHGLAFCIDETVIETETRFLFARERAGPAYVPAYIPLQSDHGPLTALAFVADHGAEAIADHMSREDIVRYMATGRGWMGSSLEYGQNILRHFDELGIADPELARLVAEAEALQETL